MSVAYIWWCGFWIVGLGNVVYSFIGIIPGYNSEWEYLLGFQIWVKQMNSKMIYAW